MSANSNVAPLTIFPLAGGKTAAAQAAPISVAASGTLATGWFSAANLTWVSGILLMGVGDCTSTTVKFEQATDSSGTGVKDCTGTLASVTAFGATDDGKAFTLEGIVEQCVDVANSFTFLRMKATCTGGTANLLAGCVIAGPNQYGS